MSTRPQTRGSPTTHAAKPLPPPPPPINEEIKEDSETEDEEQEQQATAAASRNTARTATSTSRLMTQVMNVRKSPPSTAALTRLPTATLASNIIGNTASPQHFPSISESQNLCFKATKCNCCYCHSCLTPCCCCNANRFTSGWGIISHDSRWWKKSISCHPFSCWHWCTRRNFGWQFYLDCNW